MTGVQVVPPENLPEPLTEREREILVCLADDLSNQEIANKLYLAEKTVRWYNSQIYSKLRVSNRHEAVTQAQALGLLAAALPTPPVIIGKHNLPAQTTPFIGRQHELRDLTTLLTNPDIRLITILAPGGMGKTRLAIEAARTQLGRYADGVIFVPLAPLSASNDIVTTIAETIGFSFYGNSPPARQLIDSLRDRSMLLVLDNFEHLLDGVDIVADMVQVASGIRLLTTSRERLNLQGETMYTLRGMEFPTWEMPADALAYDAVKLFMQSAQRVRFDYALHAHDLAYLAHICRLTEGMPLGIELAAGWIDMLPLERIAAEIQQGIDILETDMRDVPERHRSLQATFENTWGRLTEEEQQVFMRLSVFRGGFTVQAAQVVAGADVRSLRRLANKALVRVSPDNRYDIHELLRQFGAEKLRLVGAEPHIQARHAAFFAEFMATCKDDIRTNRQLEALALIDPDFENVRSAWLFAVNQQQWEQLPKFLHALWFYLDVRTCGQDAVALFEQAVQKLQLVSTSAVTELALGQVFARLSWFYNDTGFPERCVITSDEAMRICRQHNDPETLLAAMFSRALGAAFVGQAEVGAALLHEGVGIAQSIGDKSWEGHFLVWIGLGTYDKPDMFRSAFQCTEDGLALLEALGDRWGLMGAYKVLGKIQETQQDYAQAIQWFDQVLKLARGFDHTFSLATLHQYLGTIYLAQHDGTTARQNFGKTLQVFCDAGYQWMIPFPIVSIAQFHAAQNDTDRAVELLAAIHKHPLAAEGTNEFAQILRDQLEASMDAERFAAAWTRGQGWELDAVVVALLAENVGE